jgi:hypothetical protein
VATREEADEDALEHPVLADDDASDLEEDGFRGRSRVVEIGKGTQVAPWRGGRFGHAIVSRLRLAVRVWRSDAPLDPDYRVRT